MHLFCDLPFFLSVCFYLALIVLDGFGAVLDGCSYPVRVKARELASRALQGRNVDVARRWWNGEQEGPAITCLRMRICTRLTVNVKRPHV